MMHITVWFSSTPSPCHHLLILQGIFYEFIYYFLILKGILGLFSHLIICQSQFRGLRRWAARAHLAICSIGLLACGGAALAVNRDEQLQICVSLQRQPSSSEPARWNWIHQGSSYYTLGVVPLYELPLLQRSTATKSSLVTTSQENDRVITSKVFLLPRITLSVFLVSKVSVWRN